MKIVDKINYGNIEVIKIFAIFFMVLDHAYHYFLKPNYIILFYFGRVSLYLFIFSYSISLVKSNKISNQTIILLFISGLISSYPFYELNKTWLIHGLPLNILFNFLFATIVIKYSKNKMIVFIFTVISVFVEYDLSAFLLIIGTYYFLKNENKKIKYFYFLIILIGFIYLKFINQNIYSIFSIILILIIILFDFKIKRIKYLGYYFYPIHLFLILLIKIL